VVPEPRVLYEAVLLRSDEDGIVYQAGAFSTEAEAQKVLDVWRAEDRQEPMAVHETRLAPSGGAQPHRFILDRL
jgi:hypothetical protein